MNDDKKYIELEGVDTLVSDIRDKVYGVLAQKADLTQLPQNMSELNNDVGYISQADLSIYEHNDNKVTSISSSSTDVQYPSAKCVYDAMPRITYGTTDLTPGVSPLEEGTFYFVYE